MIVNCRQRPCRPLRCLGPVIPAHRGQFGFCAVCICASHRKRHNQTCTDCPDRGTCHCLHLCDAMILPRPWSDAANRGRMATLPQVSRPASAGIRPICGVRIGGFPPVGHVLIAGVPLQAGIRAASEFGICHAPDNPARCQNQSIRRKGGIAPRPAQWRFVRVYIGSDQGRERTFCLRHMAAVRRDHWRGQRLPWSLELMHGCAM